MLMKRSRGHASSIRTAPALFCITAETLDNSKVPDNSNSSEEDTIFEGS